VPPYVESSFKTLHRHLCRLTEQHDSTGELDFDNVLCRGLSMNDNDGITLTGLRVLSTGKNLTIPASETVCLDADDGYEFAVRLFEDIGLCRDAILQFMREQKKPEDIQGKLFGTPETNVILSSKAQTAADVVFPDLTKEPAKDESPVIDVPDKNWIMPPTWDKDEPAAEQPADRFAELKQLAKERDLTTAEQQEYQKLNADSKKKRPAKK